MARLKTLQEIYEPWSSVGVGHGDKGTNHGYIGEYERLLTPYREKPVNMLEVGLALGQSLEMWHEFFHHPDARIYGIDKTTAMIAPYLTDERFTIWITDSTKPAVLGHVGDTKFDVIIDDASHRPEEQRYTFHWLSPLVRPGGLYVIEDVKWGKKQVRRGLMRLREGAEVIDRRAITGCNHSVLVVYHF